MFDNTGNPAIVDEWTFGQYQAPNVALAALTNHWNTWITENDFQLIAAAGCVCWSATFERLLRSIYRLNHVRIPIGYWAYDVGPGEPYFQGQREYLGKAIGWAKKYGIKVIVDLHGAPGSQNGYAHSHFGSHARNLTFSALTTQAIKRHSLYGKQIKQTLTARMQLSGL